MKGIVLTSTATSVARMSGSASSIFREGSRWARSRALFSLNVNPAIQGLVQQSAFSSVHHLLMGTLLLYHFRVFERRMGSRKFAAFAASITVMSAVGQYAASRLLDRSFDSGPFGIIFACFVPFLLTVPSVEFFDFLGMRLSDKSFPILNGIMVRTFS